MHLRMLRRPTSKRPTSTNTDAVLVQNCKYLNFTSTQVQTLTLQMHLRMLPRPTSRRPTGKWLSNTTRTREAMKRPSRVSRAHMRYVCVCVCACICIYIVFVWVCVCLSVCVCVCVLSDLQEYQACRGGIYTVNSK